VNLTRVREVKPTGRGDCAIVLGDGRRLPLSRRYRDALEAELAVLG
jgi:DNA-binding LytR/AlgR family response regulator